MTKVKMLPAGKRPNDYLMATCPLCGNEMTQRIISGQINKTEYNCSNGYTDYSVRPSVRVGCQGLVTYNINPKYQ